jgi:hypothetical protein
MIGSVAGFVSGIALIDDFAFAAAPAFFIEAVGSTFVDLDMMPGGISGAVGGASAEPAEVGCSACERARRGT